MGGSLRQTDGRIGAAGNMTHKQVPRYGVKRSGYTHCCRLHYTKYRVFNARAWYYRIIEPYCCIGNYVNNTYSSSTQESCGEVRYVAPYEHLQLQKPYDERSVIQAVREGRWQTLSPIVVRL